MSTSSAPRIVFIGAGNMAEALVSGLIRRNVAPRTHIAVTDIREEQLAHFASTYGVVTSNNNVAAVSDADVVVLAVKPQGMREVLAEIASAATGGKLFISIAAGITLPVLEALIGAGARVVRAMPNTPALVGKGITAICAGTMAGEADLDAAESILGAAGRVVRVTEDQMDAVTAVSGSGPAYLFYVMEAMLSAAQRLGLDETLARELVLTTVEGAARLADESGAEPGELRRRVTSKGGTTAAALSVMEEEEVFDHIVTAILAAYERSKELSGQA